MASHVCLEKARHRAWFRCLPLILLFCARAPGQTPAVDGNGVTAEWDVRSYMTQLVADVQQSKSSLDAMEHLVAATEDLSRQPEKLSAAIETFFQLERMELLVASLNNGVRKWQSEHTANEMSEALSANMVHRDRLRQHIRDLASARENEQRIMNEEAQRCRGMLTREAPAPPVRSAPRRSRRQVRP
jgi:hypothetical protein